MKHRILNIAATLLVLGLATAMAQKANQWTDWSKKDAQKILDDSPWGHIQTDTDTREMMFSPTAGAGTSSVNSARAVSGANNQAINLTFRVRFFSARPIRQALARMMELENANLKAEQLTKLHSFAEIKSSDSIIITVSFDSPDGRYSGPAIQAFGSNTTATLKNDCYLQRSDGKQLFLQEYVPPGKDGFGARFIFSRDLDGQPFINNKSGEIRFYAKFPELQKIDRRFKVADMMYQGQLEY
ncbi:MAG TPA: hypothetical protein DC054_20960 [Blastocatellia bacterium]|nr:hypothetical protein [Blastocatellia bacterium]